MRQKSHLRSCEICHEKFEHRGSKTKFCSRECVKKNTAKRREYHRARYLERVQAQRRQLRVPPLVRKVAKEWQVSYDEAKTYIERGTFPP